MKRKITSKIKRKSNKLEYDLDGIPSSKLKMKYYKKIRHQKRIKTKIFQAHSFLKFLSILAMLWLCSRLMICKYWYLPQNTFNTYPNIHMRIIGNKITPDDKIISALKRHPIPKIPIYLVNTTPYEKEIEKLSPVKKAFVRRYWLPTRFEVTIEEEIPLLTIAPSPSAPEIAALTKKGGVIEKEYLPVDENKYKTYKILTYDDYKTWTPEEIYHLKVLAQRLEDYSGDSLIYLDIRNKNDVFARLKTVKIRIGELNSTLKERIERLSSVIPQIKDLNLERQTEYVDLRWDNTTYLKKKSKNSSISEEDIYKEEAQQKTENPKQEKKVSVQQKKEMPTKVNDNKTVIKPNTSSPKNEVKIQPQKAAQPARNSVQKNIEPQSLPDIDIQIVEP